MDVLEAMNWRYATRQFADERIDVQQLRQLLDAARLSASSYGLQPYRLLVIDSAQTRRQLLPHSLSQQKVVDCSHLIVFAAQTDVGEHTVSRYIDSLSTQRGQPTAELQPLAEHMQAALAAKTPAQRLEWAHQQAYLALGTLLTCAAMMRIDACPMTGIDAAGYDRVLGLAQRQLTTSVICPVGRRHPDDDAARLPKVRADYRDMVIPLP